MNELSRHIEKLLLSHDCVIVPQLGGFVTQYVSARHVGCENLFLPPRRTVGFNPQLKLNDGLLVQSYMQAHETSYPETLRIIEEAVLQLKNQLQQQGSFEFHGIGRLEMDFGGSYRFIPNEAGVLSPALYGLSSFTITPQSHTTVSCNSRKTENKETADTPRKKKPKETYTLKFNKDVINYAAAAAVAVFFYFLWATPIAPVHTSVVPETASCRPVQRPPLPANISPKPVQATEPVAQPAPTTDQDTIPAPETEDKEHYTIVVMSRITKKNAETVTEQMRRKGLDQANLTARPGMVRVVYGRYADEAQAYAQLEKLRQKDAIFAEAWIMKN